MLGKLSEGAILSLVALWWSVTEQEASETSSVSIVRGGLHELNSIDLIKSLKPAEEEEARQKSALTDYNSVICCKIRDSEATFAKSCPELKG